MRIHTDKITYQDINNAARFAETKGDGKLIVYLKEHGSRSRSRAFEVALEGDGSVNKRRRNPGTSTWDRDRGYAATWNAWGWFLAYLFEVDPAMSATYYTGADDFHGKTRYQFLLNHDHSPSA